MIELDDEADEPRPALSVTSAPPLAAPYCKNCGIQQPLSRPEICPECHKDPRKVQR